MEISTILTQMGILVVIMVVGYVCAKLGITGAAFNKSAASLVMNVLLVATILGSAAAMDLTVSAADLAEIILIPFIILMIGGILGLIAPKLLKITGDAAGIANFSILFMNSVFVGFPVIEALYGAKGVFFASLSNVAYNLLLYTYGVAVMCGRGSGQFSLKKMFNAPLISTLAALVIILLRIRVPAFIAGTCTTVGRATVPMSMIVIGTSLGAISVKDAMKGWKLYIIAVARLLLCPIATWAVLRLFITDPMMLGVFVILAATPTALMTTIFAIRYGKDEVLASQNVFISTVLSAVTMPVIIWLLL